MPPLPSRRVPIRMVYQTDRVQLYQGHSGETLRHLPSCIAHTIVTSPPYWGQRVYTNLRHELGREALLEAYVDDLVGILREARRVLREDGTLWLNLGDKYRNGTKLGIPWKVAFALVADGWRLVQDIIWHKPNPMPESVKRRCTTAHEFIFLLAKSPDYYFDADAIREPATYAGQSRGGSTNRYAQNKAGMDRKVYDTRNKRDVWSVKPVSGKGAHFAPYPVDLIQPCILAGSPPGGIVLDPFLGSGTTAIAALLAGRRCWGIDLNPEYIEAAWGRIGREAEEGALLT